MKALQKLAMMVLACCIFVSGYGQYSMDELGIEGGIGVAILPNAAQLAIGPAIDANFYYSHYACGKAYGFHLSAGFNAAFPGNSSNGNWIDHSFASRSRLQIIGLDAGAYGKIRLHEYHRPKEWAILVGPKITAPLVTRYSTDLESGNLGKNLSVNRILPGIHVSMQFRRTNKKQSWFVHPGFEYYFVPLFKSNGGGNVRQATVFLRFAYSFWDQRG